MNGVPRNVREELIAELEGLGYDVMPGVSKGWRERLSDEQLRAAIHAAGDASEFPDIAEMVDAMRGAVVAADAVLAVDAGGIEPETPEWLAWQRAFAALRALVSRIDVASARAFGDDDV